MRGNLFVTPPINWQLREWKLVILPDGSQSFAMATVKKNPIPELYGPRETEDDLDNLRESFKASFVDTADSESGTYLEQLTIFDRGLLDGSLENKDALSASVGMSPAERFDDFQSDAQGSEDDPLVRAQRGDMQARIDAKLASLAECEITMRISEPECSIFKSR